MLFLFSLPSYPAKGWRISCVTHYNRRQILLIIHYYNRESPCKTRRRTDRARTFRKANCAVRKTTVALRIKASCSRYTRFFLSFSFIRLIYNIYTHTTIKLFIYRTIFPPLLPHSTLPHGLNNNYYFFASKPPSSVGPSALFIFFFFSYILLLLYGYRYYFSFPFPCHCY